MSKKIDDGETAISRYHKKNVRKYQITLTISNDIELIDYLDSLANKSGFIKETLKKEMKKAK